jgi:hypothetical protein
MELLQQTVQRPVMAFSQLLDPLHKTRKKFLVPTDGGSLGGDGVAQLAQVCWVIMVISQYYVSGKTQKQTVSR